ncbi:hypothetical protein [Desulforapulum autotrophicum]|nr:hypothetical protein [Desulforapulum autotrophicum]
MEEDTFKYCHDVFKNEISECESYHWYNAGGYDIGARANKEFKRRLG